MNAGTSGDVPATYVEHVESPMTVRDGSHEHIGWVGCSRLRHQRVALNHLLRVEHTDAVRAVLAMENDWPRKG